MISELKIGNFKAFGPAQTIPLRPVTLVFGPNSAGKSSVIQSLLLARHILDTGKVDAHQTTIGGAAVDLGGFGKYVWNHDTGLQTSIQFVVPRSAITRKLYELDAFQTLRVSYSIGKETPTESESKVVITSAVLWLNDHELLRLKRSVSGELLVDTDALESKSLLMRLMPQALGLKAIEDLTATQELEWAQSETIREHQRTQANEERRLAVHEFGQMKFSPEFLTLENLRPLSREYPDYDIFGSDLDFDRPEHDPYGFYERDLKRESADENTEPHSSEVWARVFRFSLECLIEGVTTAIRGGLNTLCYLGPLRWIPPRLIPDGDQFDASWAAGGGDAWQRLRREPELLERVNHFLRDILRTRYRLECHHFARVGSIAAPASNLPSDPLSARCAKDSLPAATLRVQNAAETITTLSIVEAESGLTVSHRDVGTGISQLLPVLVNAAGAKERLIAIEQPELHLHPALQAELGDVFIESALSANKNTFLIETHSEHLILRILRRIRETAEHALPEGVTPIRPADLCVLYVEPGNDGSRVIHLPVNAEGDFDQPWPDGFFSERAKELF